MIGKAYRWLWHDVCGLPEPFTYYMRLSAKANPLWWALLPALVGAAWWALITHLWGLY